MKQFSLNVALLCGSILFAVTFAECGLRWKESGTVLRLESEGSLRIPHPVRGWTLAPRETVHWSKLDRDVLIRTNEKGLRDRPHAYAPEPGVFRIVVIGDSFMEAYQVEFEESFPYLLQETLADRRVEVINLGVGGYGTAQEYLYLRDEGLRYQPDLVILAFFTGNDVQDNSRRLKGSRAEALDVKSAGRPYAQPSPDGSELRWSLPDIDQLRRIQRKKEQKKLGFWKRLGRQLEPAMLGVRIERMRAKARLQITGKPENNPNTFFAPFIAEFLPELGDRDLTRADYEEIWDEAWGTTLHLIRETRTLANRHGAEFAVLIVPERLQVEPDFRALAESQNPGVRLDPERIGADFAEFSAATGIPVLDLTPIFGRAYAEQGRRLYHRLGDRHWNPAGHAMATSEMIEFLDARGLLPPAGRSNPTN